MAKTPRKAAQRGDFTLRVTRALALHGLTIAQAGELSDADLRRRKGIGRTLIASIRAAAGPAPPSPPPVANERGWAARDRRIATLERQMAELLEAVRQLQEALRVRGADRRAPLTPEPPPEEGRQASSPDQSDHVNDGG